MPGSRKTGALCGMHIDIPSDEAMPHAGDWIAAGLCRYVVLHVESLIPHWARDEPQRRFHLACQEVGFGDVKPVEAAIFVMHSYDS